MRRKNSWRMGISWDELNKSRFLCMQMKLNEI